jgi:1,4-alpha-glucan branching enzyme
MPIDLTQAGAFPSVDAAGVMSLRFGLYLPGVTQTAGFQVVVRIIHQDDRFDPSIQPVDVKLTWQAGELDLWMVTTQIARGAGHYGLDGIYLYRFQLLWTSPAGQQQVVSNWFTDPFSRQTDVGMLAAVNCSSAPVPAPAWTDAAWRTPSLDDLVVYELHVDEFNNTFQGVIDRLTYLKSLGVNCLELMPVTSTKLDFDWGYGPIQYFAPNSAYGGPDGLKALVDAAHAQGVAVIIDLVYQHVDPAFPYAQVYSDIAAAGLPLATIPSPMIGANGPFGPEVDFSQTFAQQFFKTANQYWLDEFHLDGFRYDEVTDLFQSATDTGYALLAYETYRYSTTIARFGCAPGTWSRIIQAAEALSIAPVVLRETYTSAAWQDDLLNSAESAIGQAAGSALAANSLTSLAHTLDPFFGGKYPSTKTVVDSVGNPVQMPVAPFQYLNSHDHSHLICFAGTTGDGPIPSGDRGKYFMLQPFAIALYTAQGVPMLWEGEELADNYNLPSAGSARINLRRDMNIEYFYDAQGAPIVRLYRILGKLRAASPALRGRESFFYNQQSLQGNSVLAYHRHAPATATVAEQYAMVVLNFSPNEASITLPFPKAGVWIESIDANPATDVTAPADGTPQTVTVPSWYGRVFLL